MDALTHEHNDEDGRTYGQDLLRRTGLRTPLQELTVTVTTDPTHRTPQYELPTVPTTPNRRNRGRTAYGVTRTAHPPMVRDVARLPPTKTQTDTLF